MDENAPTEAAADAADESTPLVEESRSSRRGSTTWENRLQKNPAFRKSISQEPPKREVPSDPYNDQNRGCTDWPCIIILFVGIGLLVHVIHYAQKNGDFRRLSKGLDFRGNLCGVDVGYQDTPLQFYCANPVKGPGLDMDHPICIKSCPTSTNTSNLCYTGKKAMGETKDDLGSIYQTTKYEFAHLPDYPTRGFMGRYCQPLSPTYSAQLKSAMNAEGYQQWLMRASEVQHSWRVLLGVIALGVLLGFLYMKFLQWFATVIVYALFLVSGGIPLAVGIQLIYASQAAGVTSVVDLGNQELELALGVICTVFGSSILLFLCCAGSAIDQACACIKVACDCMYSTPSLLVVPLFDVAVKLVVLTIMCYYFLLLITSGDIQKRDVTQLDSSIYPSMLDRSFQYNDEQKVYLFAMLFLIFWAYEFLSALAIFANAFAVRTWYFVQYDDPNSENPQKHGLRCCPTLTGYYYGFKYHLGSIAFGSILLPPIRMLQLALYALEKAMSGDNDLAKVLLYLLQGIVFCILKCVEYLTEQAYIIIAIDSLSFCDSGWKALKLTWLELGLFSAVYCANLVFSFIGVLGITCLGLGITWPLIMRVPEFKDPANEFFIVDPFVFLVIAGLILIGVGFCIVSQMGNISNTVMLCYAYDKHYRVKDDDDMGGLAYAPKSLQAFYDKVQEDPSTTASDDAPGEKENTQGKEEQEQAGTEAPENV
jgi:hypothetical protein